MASAIPRHVGGPMFYADAVGLPTVLARVKQYRDTFGDYWKPAPLLEKLAAEGKGSTTRRSAPFEERRRALTAAHAHRHDTVTGFPALHFIGDGADQPRAGHAERVADRD